MKKGMLAFFIVLLFIQNAIGQKYEVDKITEPEYVKIQEELKQGWNTWRNHSMTSHVLLPENLCINIGIKDKRLFGEYHRFFYASDDENFLIRPGKLRSLDGTYTEMSITIKGIELEIQSAVYLGEQYILVTPKSKFELIQPDLVVELGNIWGGHSTLVTDAKNGTMTATSADKKIVVRSSEKTYIDYNLETFANSLSMVMTDTKPIAIYTGAPKTIEEIERIVAENKAKVLQELSKFGEQQDIAMMHYAMLGWSTIYEPEYDRVVTPGAGRWWNKRFQGYVVWGWDFTGYNFLPFDKNLAYTNMIEIFRHMTPEGFFPNYYMGYDRASRDRSQPPVYSFAIRELYEKYQDDWFVDLSFDYLYRNHQWWIKKRNKDGYLCWGSDNLKYDWDANTKQAAMFESGLDNSPMFDKAIYNKESGLLEQADVGLMSLYILDAEALLDLAKMTGRKKEAKVIAQNKKAMEAKLKSLWSEEEGIFLNKFLDTKQYGKFNKVVSPTNMYPLFLNIVSKKQVNSLLENYFYNEDKFYGEYIIPSITRDDPAYKDQSYWRGRIWPPMNLFVYLGMKRQGKEKEAAFIARKSSELVMKTYAEDHWIRENFHGDFGDGTPCTNECFGGSDIYYTWGSVFGIPILINEGFYPKFFD